MSSPRANTPDILDEHLEELEFLLARRAVLLHSPDARAAEDAADPPQLRPGAARTPMPRAGRRCLVPALATCATAECLPRETMSFVEASFHPDLWHCSPGIVTGTRC